MAKDDVKNKLVESITDRDADFAQWYTDVVKKAELADYSSAQGFIVYRPYGYAIWELIQKQLDIMFKEAGHENVYMPTLIPESLLQREKSHVAGFAPEVAWVTQGGEEKLAERFCICPTSETLFCEHYAKIIQSHRDLPKLYNQWRSVVRWEKTTRPFLRGREFLWQEGHTAHATAEESHAETLRMLDIYAEFCKNYLAIPVVKGQKTEKEKFAGAKNTYAIESLMHDGKALQAGTSHDFGDGFARAFGIQYTDKSNELRYVHQTSWGVTTRLIGALIMVHGDNSGLVLPPMVAPVQAVIIPIAAHKPGVMEKAEEIYNNLKSDKEHDIRVKIDASDKSPGWKFSEREMKGVPIRIELGPKDLENGEAVLVRRDTGAKAAVKFEKLTESVINLLGDIQKNLYDRALEHMNKRTFAVTGGVDDMKAALDETPGFVKAMWCGSEGCEDEIKEKAGATSRCIPFEQEKLSDKCVCCGEPAVKMVYWGRAY